MPSIRARIFNAYVRLLIKRRDWGPDKYALARRARRLFGAPLVSRWLSIRDLGVQPVNDASVRGEWLSVEEPDAQAIVLYIHGGGFVACSPATHRPISAGLARLTRLRVFSLDYRLAPEHPFPAAFEDVVAAYHRLRKENPEVRIAVAGDSAGGGLTLSLLLKLKNDGIDLPSCAVCFSAWTDLTGSGESVKANEKSDRMFYASTISSFADAYVSRDERENVYASPVFGDFAAMPPILFQVGSTEVLVDDSRRIHEKIQAAGGESELQIYDDVFHSWQMGVGLLPEADAAMKDAAEFIRRHSVK
ncbi:MAG: alpha/beta hydrolase [Acidobacteriota bacterium]